ncbi:Murein DD-endopeptidase MepM [Pseudovibrio axinellae]|uniref:Murein DD-endopeptidase MepM n=1 Tax=Pseudovibrio axinellae TaxID=989403 RepID=A0A166B2K5_9HYPH|nr:M23 family metallopeptidase [Pseudovibrio axinellae]KZL21832.1 Murein DD-endopeptidase MepM [Pseudovibrio axinellae]SEQ80150.1 Murein DD-endopeptidase MepM and murein hydrolase activator NlpD, contain LysM domain [Pseudovibrio axinellae]
MKLSSCSDFSNNYNQLKLDSPAWLSRIKAELSVIPPMAYWLSGLTMSAVVSAVLASNFQQSLSEIKFNSTLSRERALLKNYQSEIQDLKIQLSELRGRIGQREAKQDSANSQDQQEALQQVLEIEALVNLAESSNLFLSLAPPSPKRKPQGANNSSAPITTLSYTQKPRSMAASGLLQTLTAPTKPMAQQNTPSAALNTKQRQAQQLLAAYTQAALDDIKRVSTLLKNAGVAQTTFTYLQSSTGGVYQDLQTSDLSSSMIAARQIIEQRIQLNTKVNALPFARPLPNFTISSTYGARTDPFLGRTAIHTGIDFKAPRNTPIKATGSGIISLSKYNGGYGLSVEIVHDNGLVTRYAHMQKILVSKGQRVNIGDIVGTVGSTGRSTGPHLHYEVRLNGSPIDPMRFIRTGDRLAAIFRPSHNTKIALNLP